MVRTPDGQQTIKSGQRIILAQATLGGAGGGAIGGTSLGPIIGGSLAGAAILGGTIYGINEQGKDDKEGSPFTPPS
jgi:hypothetical protein